MDRVPAACYLEAMRNRQAIAVMLLLTFGVCGLAAGETRVAPTTGPTTRPTVVDSPLWGLLRTGQCIIVLRHAKTVGGSGDPGNFNLADRGTQRNLSDDGVAQAKRIGQVLQAQNVPIGKVLTSEYFRCAETAELAFGKQHVVREPALNSLKDQSPGDDAPDPMHGQQVLAQLKLLKSIPQGGNTVLVTHRNNQFALTRIVPEMGEAVIVQPKADGSYQIHGVLVIDTASSEPASSKPPSKNPPSTQPTSIDQPPQGK